MKLSRRPPPPDPEARRQALSRLRAASHRQNLEGDSQTPDERPTERSGGRPGARPDARLTERPDGHPGARPGEGPGARPGARLDARTEESPEEVRGGWTPSPAALPDRLKGSLWTLSPRHVVVLALVLLVGLTWAAYSLLRSSPEPIPNTPTSLTSGSPVAAPPSGTAPPGTGSASPGPGAAGTPGTPTTVVVHVAGKVRRPGLVRTPTGSRVADVLEAAGGALPGVDLTTLNLARPVTDGEQIVVGIPSLASAIPPTSGVPTPGSTGTPGASTAVPIDLNTATLGQLDGLPGVGPVLAQRILDWRNEHGRFTSTDELQEVPGVGPKKFESLKPHVRV